MHTYGIELALQVWKFWVSTITVEVSAKYWSIHLYISFFHFIMHLNKAITSWKIYKSPLMKKHIITHYVVNISQRCCMKNQYNILETLLFHFTYNLNQSITLSLLHIHIVDNLEFTKYVKTLMCVYAVLTVLCTAHRGHDLRDSHSCRQGILLLALVDYKWSRHTALV